MGHMVIQRQKISRMLPLFREKNCRFYIIDINCTCLSLNPPLFFPLRFFFKSQVIATSKFEIGKCEDFVWVTKDELLEFFPKQAEFLNKKNVDPSLFPRELMANASIMVRDDEVNNDPQILLRKAHPATSSTGSVHILTSKT
ncbi:putative protein phosphatase 2C 1 [Morella rubra]|uniref:39S ribosomal protein L46, mitochondrial n=1 Tax=Morella rubra TaxID=262757 RepID=A0A6A1UI32_9ROSI|nr:putative protein phosphatase 2C 1 [Morella rubra]